MKTAVEYIKDIKEALKYHGEYDYYDKGAESIMDIPSYKEFKGIDVEEIKKVLKEILMYEHGSQFVSDVLYRLQDDDEIIDPLLLDEEIGRHY